MADHIEVKIANRLDEIPRLAEALDAFCADNGVPAGVAYNLNLVLDELITNLVSYGYDDAEPHQIIVHAQVADDRITADMIDDGKPFDPLHEAPAPRLDAPLEERPIGGLGIYFVRTLMDEVRYERDGAHNRLTLIKRLAD